jgi:outer membrane immunogenic protein
MKTFALAVSIFAIGAQTASAADMAVKARPIPVAATYNWTGCYIGGNIGSKWAQTSDAVNIPRADGPGFFTGAQFLDLGNASSDTLIGGGQIGCNWQTGSVVFGVEGDADAQRWKRSRTITGVLPPLFAPGDIYELRSDWQASLRGRVGYAWDRTLLYATGGVAFTDVRAYTNWIPVVTGNITFPGVITSQTKTLVGATVGAGVERAVTDNFTVGIEGRYTWYGTQRFNSGLLPTSVITLTTFTMASTYRDVRVETGEVMLKANWKFNSGPLVARY